MFFSCKCSKESLFPFATLLFTFGFGYVTDDFSWNCAHFLKFFYFSFPFFAVSVSAYLLFALSELIMLLFGCIYYRSLKRGSLELLPVGFRQYFGVALFGISLGYLTGNIGVKKEKKVLKFSNNLIQSGAPCHVHHYSLKQPQISFHYWYFLMKFGLSMYC